MSWDRNFSTEKVFRSNIDKDYEWDFSKAQLDRQYIYNPRGADFPGIPKPKAGRLCASQLLWIEGGCYSKLPHSWVEEDGNKVF